MQTLSCEAPIMLNKHSPLHGLFNVRAAKSGEFAGWELPLYFTGIVAEHNAVRHAAGLFDISHMGQIKVTGKDAASFLQNIITNDLEKTIPQRGIYAHICREDGGVIDDVFVYNLDKNDFLIVSNASRHEAVMEWLTAQKNGYKADIKFLHQNAGIAIQGPNAKHITGKLFPQAAQLPRHGIKNLTFAGMEVMAGRTGYTGEDGFEIFGVTENMWVIVQALLESGQNYDMLLCGLAARDTLRLEMGYILYGQDIDLNHTPVEANMNWVIKFDKNNFIGREALLAQKEKGTGKLLTGIKLEERGVPRHLDKICKNSAVIGELTSGGFSPTLNAGIGMGYVPRDLAIEGESVEIVTTRNTFKARIVRPPFIKRREM